MSVALSVVRQVLNFIKRQSSLLTLMPAWFWNRTNEAGCSARFDYLLCRLPLLVEFPMQRRVTVWRIENRLIEKLVTHYL
ncbi:hypothetical protein Xmlh_11525 [Xanthomonas axonopodis pv. melhusii]|uniref:Uncharacterized protein n=2 Tax=Xanthomonas TaxID=338 RepID=A0A1T1P1L5_9XANT|nr:hypothetical protein Xmlh_11525 [Xanthomonas axonopodis pv. melhusii]